VAFVLPTFNIVVNIYSAGFPPPIGTPRLVDIPAQLRAPAANNVTFISSGVVNSAQCLLLAPGTDIRDRFCTPINSSDYVEAPAGTGRFYNVTLVDDIGRGFPNEHRFAILQKLIGIPWPTPIP